MPLPNDARKVRGTIEGSINVDSRQQHHESGCSVTKELVAFRLCDFGRRDIALQQFRGVGKPGLRGLLDMR